MDEKSMRIMRTHAFLAVPLALLFLFPFITSAASCPNLYRNLSFGSRGNDVVQLQDFLIAQGDLVAGNNTGYFGNLTRSAVRTFQCREMQICSGSETTNGYGSVGPKTRARIQAVCSAHASVPTAPSVPPVTYTPPPTPTFSACVPLPAQTQIVACPAGQTGSIMQTRTSTCSNSAISPTWGTWVTTANTCQVISAQQSGIFSVKDYGAKCDASTDDTAAIQAAENAREAAGGGVLYIPSGVCRISGAIRINKGGIVEGVLGGQSVIRSTSSGANAFEVQTTDAITFRNLQIDPGGQTKTQGIAILIRPSAPPHGALMNRQSIIDHVTVRGFAGAIELYNSANFSITNNTISDFHNNGIYINQNETVIDQGDGIISGNTIDDHAIAGAAAIRLDPAAAVEIIGNTLRGAVRGVWLTVSQGPTGTLNIVSNSIQEQSVSGVYVEQSAPGKYYGNVIVANNVFTNTNSATAQSGVTFAAGISGPYLSNVVISNNVFNMSLGKLSIINLSDGVGVNINGNSLNNNGHAGAFGIVTDNNASNVTVYGNAFANIPSGNYGPLTSTTAITSGANAAAPGLTMAVGPVLASVSDIPSATGVFSVKDYGAKCDASTDDTTAIQAAENAREAVGGGMLYFPPGFCVVSGKITITRGGVIQGAGHGQTDSSFSASVIRTSSPTADIFHVITPEAITFREVQIDSGSMVKSQGTAIRIEPSQPPYGTLTNKNSRIENVRINQMANGIALYNAADFRIEGSYISDFHNNGIYAMHTAGANIGSPVISGNSVWDLNVSGGGAGIRLDPGGAVSIVGNKILGATRGIWLTVSQTAAGLRIISNSIEQQDVSGIYVEQTVSGKTYSNLKISENEISLIGMPEAQSGITFAAGESGPYLTNAAISNNVFNSTHDRLANINLSTGNGVTISGNVINNLGHVGAFGIITDNQATNVAIFGNTFSQIPSGNYGPLTSGTTVQD